MTKKRYLGKTTDYDPPVCDHTGAPAMYEFGFDIWQGGVVSVLKIVAKDYNGMPTRPEPSAQLMAYLACFDKENFYRLVNGDPLVRR